MPGMFSFTEIRLPLAGVVTGLALLAFVREPGRAAAAAAAFPAGSPAGSVGGVVLDSHGDPVPGALVLVLDADGRAVAEGQTSLDADDDSGRSLGEFHIAGLPAGQYGIRAVVPDSDVVARLSNIPVRPWEDTRVRIRVDLGY